MLFRDLLKVEKHPYSTWQIEQQSCCCPNYYTERNNGNRSIFLKHETKMNGGRDQYRHWRKCKRDIADEIRVRRHTSHIEQRCQQ